MNGKHIVIVDDESIVTSALKVLLNVEGFKNVEFFNDPKQALSFVKAQKPALVISDFLMPQMNGIEFLSEVKKLYADATMILLTGYADKENAIKAINDVGIYRYLEKPWENDDLIFNIKNALERSDLLSKLQEKVNELEIANEKIENYSKSLENIVAERTQNLVEANEKISAVINYCADGIAILNPDLKIESANPTAENLSGAALCLLSGKNFFDILKLENGNFTNKDLNEYKETFLRNCYIENFANGQKIPVEVSLAPIFGAQDEIVRYVAVIRDYRVQKDLDRLRDDFIATLTHDLRTPLLATIQTLKFFLDGTLGEISDKQRTFLTTMKKSNEDILGLVNALLEVYKFEAGNLTLYKTKFNLNDFLTQCIQEIKPLADEKEMKILLNIEQTKEKTVTLDKTEIRRVVFNLLGNAVSHNEGAITIELTTTLRNPDLMISVKDNGKGIPPEDIDDIFNRFSQGTSKKRSVGTGLGMYLSRQIVEAHGGKIWLETGLKKDETGSEFMVLLPECAGNQAEEDKTLNETVAV